MKHKTKFDGPPVSHRIKASSTINFTTLLSVEDCLQRLNALPGTRLSHGRLVDVVIVENHFTISVFTTVRTAPQYPSGWDLKKSRGARCTGDLKPLAEGTRIVAKAENFETIDLESRFIVWGWVIWAIGMLMAGVVSGGALITANTFLWAIITGWLPLGLHLGLHWDMRVKRRWSVDFSRWLYTVLFEYTSADAATADTVWSNREEDLADEFEITPELTEQNALGGFQSAANR